MSSTAEVPEPGVPALDSAEDVPDGAPDEDDSTSAKSTQRTVFFTTLVISMLAVLYRNVGEPQVCSPSRLAMQTSTAQSSSTSTGSSPA
jgi:hypothetical protein